MRQISTGALHLLSKSFYRTTKQMTWTWPLSLGTWDAPWLHWLLLYSSHYVLYCVLWMDGELRTVSLHRTKSLLSVWIHYTFQGLNIILGEVVVFDINYKDLMIFLKSPWRKLTSIQSVMNREKTRWIQTCRVMISARTPDILNICHRDSCLCSRQQMRNNTNSRFALWADTAHF